MKDVILRALKIFAMTLVVSVCCFFVVVSFNTLKVVLFTDDVGYEVYGAASDDSEPEFLYKYYYDDGDDKKIEAYENDGYELSKYSIRSEVPTSVDITVNVVSQIFLIIILIAFIYNDMWKYGYKDFNRVRLQNLKRGKLHGLFVGLLAILPMFILLTVLLFSKSGVAEKLPIILYAYSNCYAFEIISAISSGIENFGDVNIWRAFGYYAVLVFVPIVCTISYYIGFKDISIAEKLIYKGQNKRRIK